MRMYKRILLSAGAGATLVLAACTTTTEPRPECDEIFNTVAETRGDTIVTVVLPEVVPRRWWQSLLHGQTALYFKRLLLFEPHVVVTSVPLHLQSPETPAAATR